MAINANPYTGVVTRGLYEGMGGENARWGIDASGNMVPVVTNGKDFYLLSDLLNNYGSMDAVRNIGKLNEMELAQKRAAYAGHDDGQMRDDFAKGIFEGDLDIFSARPSNDPFSGKDGLADALKIAAMAAPVIAGGLGLFGGEAAAGDAAISGGSGVDALSSVGSEGLGSGLSAGSGASGIGGGSLGTGLTAGTTTGGIGGGAAGSGLAGAGSGALAPGFFAAESLYPVAGGISAGLGSTGGVGGSVASTGGGASILSNPGLLGAGLGALGSILGGGSKPAGTTTTTQDLPEWVKPYALQGLQGLSEAYGMTPSGVAPVTQAGNDYLQDVIGGDYLNSNPYLDAMFDRAAGKVSATTNSAFSSAGRYGSGAHTGVLSESLGNLATDIYGGNYARERAAQQSAALAAPGYGNSIISQPFLRGQNLLQGVNSIRGGTTSQPYFRNQAGEILGGALGGMALGRMFQ